MDFFKNKTTIIQLGSYLQQFIQLLNASFFLLFCWDLCFFEVYVLVIKCLQDVKYKEN